MKGLTAAATAPQLGFNALPPNDSKSLGLFPATKRPASTKYSAFSVEAGAGSVPSAEAFKLPSAVSPVAANAAAHAVENKTVSFFFVFALIFYLFSLPYILGVIRLFMMFNFIIASARCQLSLF